MNTISDGGNDIRRIYGIGKEGNQIYLFNFIPMHYEATIEVTTNELWSSIKQRWFDVESNKELFEKLNERLEEEENISDWVIADLICLVAVW